MSTEFNFNGITCEGTASTANRNSIHDEVGDILERCGEDYYIFRGEDRGFGKVSSNLYRFYVLVLPFAVKLFSCTVQLGY